MKNYLIRKIPSALGVLIVGSLLIFALMRLIPGDPAQVLAGADASPEAVAAIRDELGLNDPLFTQYLAWVFSVITFDLGRSLVIGGLIGDLIGAAALNTVVLAITALFFAVLLALLLSVGVELSGKSWARAVSNAITTIAVAIPNFVTGTVLLILFGVILVVLPAGGVPRAGLFDRLDITLQYLVLPALVLALPVAAALTRFLNDSITRELNSSYVTTARALGISPRRILLTQVLPNALPPAVTVLGLQIGQLLGGAVIVETLFAWPGLGYLTQQAITSRDYPVVQVLLLFSVALFVVVQLTTDLIHARLDPRIRLGAHA
ncbi:ABC transporter permease [Corynebacterium crudilactis]|uniref:Peptide ABC transporter permease n=1 Tax=Corynebacterium crudilactis TaxID=1652495 RepID=A0A172QWC9_9CORY|nr:ABC transporter permease [Corynebacterium crudilactis]ANE05015.1 peptide ABC transporter permease [Corynebacterium crudilactis]